LSFLIILCVTKLPLLLSTRTTPFVEILSLSPVSDLPDLFFHTNHKKRIFLSPSSVTKVYYTSHTHGHADFKSSKHQRYRQHTQILNHQNINDIVGTICLFYRYLHPSPRRYKMVIITISEDVILLLLLHRHPLPHR